VRWVIDHQPPDGWGWEVYNDERQLIAASIVPFSSYVACIVDAELRGYPSTFDGSKGKDAAS
jgi:hypothetical protein